ncbi:C40 family peptidase [Actinomadura fulvescens]|uniref:NlpC/P60 domain-containing protein n=1 Tax=Actinomadura fulvescens TaxID=46160 RepID=A0ABN3QDM5_9ACTN
MSIPLKTVCYATTVALAMSPGIAQAAELTPADQIHKPAAPGAEGAVHEAPDAPAQHTSRSVSGRIAAAQASARIGTARAASRFHLAWAAQRTTLLPGRKARTPMQQAVRKKRAQLEAKWQRRADRAIRFALAQRGRPYVYGDTGRRGFDCSGLVQQAWRRAGVSMPRVAATQYRKIRTRVPRAKLRPGDLVFFHRLGHVGMYLGKSRFIHAPSTGRRVSVERLRGHYRRSYVGAVRPGWKPLPAIPARPH